MRTETVSLLGGLLFLLLAIVGGGFTIREISMPNIPGWARIPCLLVGVALVTPFFVPSIRSDDDSTERPPAVTPQPSASPPTGEGTIYSDPTTDVSGEGIEISGLRATSQNEHPAIGDRIRIQFSLKNVSTRAVTFDETFIGARNPDGDNVDFGEANQGQPLKPGDEKRISHSIVVDAAGTWEFWPCYILLTGGDGTYCPDEWRSFEVAVG